jgi:hypothetical protein
MAVEVGVLSGEDFLDDVLETSVEWGVERGITSM